MNRGLEEKSGDKLSTVGWASQKKKEARADPGKDLVHFFYVLWFDWFSSAIQSVKLELMFWYIFKEKHLLDILFNKYFLSTTVYQLYKILQYTGGFICKIFIEHLLGTVLS